MIKNFSWLGLYDETDDDGFYVQGELAFAAERKILTEIGAPDVELIEFLSMEPEDRDDSMFTANVTERFAAWAKSKRIKWEFSPAITEPVENGESNLVYYD